MEDSLRLRTRTGQENQRGRRGIASRPPECPPIRPEFPAPRQSVALPPKAFAPTCLLRPPRSVNDPPLRLKRPDRWASLYP